jgi:hypothetical protein
MQRASRVHLVASLRTPPASNKAVGRPAGMQGLLQRVENEAGRLRAADRPVDDPPGEDVDHESDVDHAAEVLT